MKATGKIGVIIPAVVEATESELISSIFEEANKYGYDTVVFTNSSNSLDSFEENEYVHGEEKIYELLSEAELDGILFAAGRFNSTRVRSYISDIIKKSGTPCVAMEIMTEDFPYVFTSQRDDISALTEHLVTVHGYENIYCLTGPKGRYEAEERLAGFQETMQRFGLNSSRFSYGDFWKSSAKKLAADIFYKRLEMPEAVVCTNDSMAVTLCDELKSYGIRIPDQIAVTGYDGTFEALSYEPSVTTVIHKEKELAFRAVSKICEIIGSGHVENKRISIHNIQYGESCGCLPKRNNIQKKISYNMIQNKNLQELYLNSNLMEQMSGAESLEDFADKISRLTYLIPNLDYLDICLCSNWQNEKIYDITPASNQRYTDKMMLLFSNGPLYSKKGMLFPVKKLLPFSVESHEPQFTVITPVHYSSLNLGYMAMHYKNGSHYHVDTFLQYWRDSLANGLNTLINKLNIEHMNKVIEEYSVRDQLTGMLNKKGLLKESEKFISETESKGCSCLMIILSWSKYAPAPLNKNTVIDIILSNALTMLCANGKICARTGEKIFSVLMPLQKGENENETADNFILDLEQMMQKLQGQPVFPEIPDINCSHYVISSSDEAEKTLDTFQISIRENYCTGNLVNDYSVQLKRIRKEMFLSPQNEWSSDRIAENLGISNGYFRKIYKSMFNVSFKEDHINARISKAKKMLSDTNLTVMEIASKCGFNSASHFMRLFHQKTGETAVGFRRRR